MPLVILSLTLVFSIYCCAVSTSLAADASQSSYRASESTSAAMFYQPSSVIGYQPLSVAGVEIAAAYREEEIGQRYGALILIHDRGEAYDSRNVISPLRNNLINYGWSTLTLNFDLPKESQITLSVNLDKSDETKETQETQEIEPNGDNDTAKGEQEQQAAESEQTDQASAETKLPPVDNQARIEAAFALLESKGIQQVIVIGHGQGAKIALESLDATRMLVRGLILVALAEDSVTELQLAQINVPILEIYGEQDDIAIQGVRQRRAMIKRLGDKAYTVRRILGANRNFYGVEPRLLSTTRSWLKTNFVDEAKQ